MQNYTDEQLVGKYRAGDDAALEVLIARHLPVVYGFSRRYAGDPDRAADIAQETFIKVWRHIDAFDASKPFRTWIFTIAKNTALDWLKKREATPFSSFEEGAIDRFLEETGVGAPSAEEQTERALSMSRVEETLGTLPAGAAHVITMRHKENLTFYEIARELGEPLNTVKSRYRRAVLLVRKRLLR